MAVGQKTELLICGIVLLRKHIFKPFAQIKKKRPEST